MEDGGASQMFLQECGVCLLMVFIHWYLLLRQTWWHCDLPPGKSELLCLSIGTAELGSEAETKQLTFFSHEGERRTPIDPWLDRGVASEVTAARKPCLMMHDEGCTRTRKRAELNLMGWGFAHISGEHFKGCLHSWTHPLPRLLEKLRYLASIRRTNPGFWCQEVDRQNLCKLKSWLLRGQRWKICYSLCYKNNILKLHMLR